MEAAKDRRDSALRAQLGEGFRVVLRPRLPAAEADETVQELLATLRGYYISLRRRRPRKATERALSRRLPAAGTHWPFSHKGAEYHLRITAEGNVECEVNGLVASYETLKAVATSICGYAPSVSGWQFFFGSLNRDQVSSLYGEAA